VSQRVRVAAALLVALVVGAWVLPWAVVQLRNLWRVELYDSRVLDCTGDWRDWGYPCDPDDLFGSSYSFSVAGTVVRLAVVGVLVLAETDRGLSSRTPQRLDAIVADTLATHASLAAAAGVRVHADVAAVGVPGEAALLERLVANLVHNGIKYNAPDGDLWVTVQAEQPVLRVVNTGPEVAPESVPRLFEAFRRARGDRLDHSGGAGLGLTIARSIVQAHDGSVSASARPGGGMDVAVELPVGGPAS
jgi:signal transduction histidine kinase